jgi:hypothetical protein
MTKANSPDPPKLATWLMEQFSPLLQNTPLAGDLVEGFKEGRSSGWYWRQVFWAILIGSLNSFPKRWGRLAYAVGCGGLICSAWFSIFPMTGRYTAHETAVVCCGHIWFGPIQVTGPSSALPAAHALYRKSYGIPWPWSLAYQIAFLTGFQAIVVAFALGAYLGFARILRAQNFLRALIVVVVVLASSNVAATFLGVPPSDIRVSSYFVSLVGWWVLFSMPAIFALLLGMWQTNLGDDTSRPISA